LLRKGEKNRVIKQSPAAGRKPAKGAKMNVTLSKGRRP
jgi:beta-lactam-binding protein with PASTA domain